MNWFYWFRDWGLEGNRVTRVKEKVVEMGVCDQGYKGRKKERQYVLYLVCI